tara:strand:+ start:2272 stop:2931 length:660 start_codon:yes stop_codon:yes gene_type:complete
MNEILTFALVALLLVISPGPNGVLIIKSVSSSGEKAAFLNIIGLFVATFFHGAFSILGLSAIVLQSAELFFAVKIIGALYLLYIGSKAILQTFKKQSLDKQSPSTPKTNITQTVSNEHEIKINHYFVEGFLTQLLNPKVSMFYLAAFPQFMSFEHPSALHAFSLVTIHASLIFLWFTGLTKTVHKISDMTCLPALGKWVQRISGTVMIYFGGLLLVFKS